VKRNKKPRVANRFARGYPLTLLFIAGISLLLMLGCEGGGEPPKPTVVKRQRRQKPPAQEIQETVKEEKKEPAYTYNPVGKRDPFKPFIALGPKKSVSKAPLTPLQRYEPAERVLLSQRGPSSAGKMGASKRSAKIA